MKQVVCHKWNFAVLMTIAWVMVFINITAHAQSGNTSSQLVATAGTDAAPRVVIDNYSFSPVPLTVKPGTTVTWINNDDDPHTVDSTQGKFKSTTLNKGDKFEFRFTEAGEYPFFCRFHPKMTGKIIVQPSN